MSNKTLSQVVGKIVEELESLSSDERKRAVQAAMTILGEEAIKSSQAADESIEGAEKIHVRARTWMKQNEITVDQLQQVFLMDGEVIASIPGDNKKDQVRNAYILTGVARFLFAGEQKFDDAPAKALCESRGLYDSTNHSKSTKSGSDFTGSKQNGWTITQPGLKAGALLIKSIANQG
jgi:hypothetical protein